MIKEAYEKFDFENALKTALVFSKATGVSCIVLDVQNESILNSEVQAIKCGLCKKINEFTKLNHTCENVKLYGSYQAERFGGKYIFFCPLGLVNFASPIVIDGIMKASLVGGPVLMQEPQEYLNEEIFSKFIIDKKKQDDVKNIINNLPVVSADTVSALSQMLFISASHISDLKYLELLDEQKSIDVQSGIADYIQYLKTMGGDDTPKKSYPIEKERELISYISQGDKGNAQRVLNEILGHIFFATGRNINIIKARILELIVLLSRAALEGGADIEQIFGLNYKYINEINSFKDIDELSYWLSKIMIRFTDCVFNFSEVKHIDIIYKAIDYIRKNYMNKISLEDVAGHVYLSPSYFSKIFKDEMKSNFNTYLNKIRIENSKNLLMNDSINLVDISNMVGFEDQSYYSKVFKKMCGITPGKYRETRGINTFGNKAIINPDFG